MCGLVLLNFNLLQKHVENFHASVNLPNIFTCDMCQINMADLPSLEKHKQTYHAVTKFSCNLCEFSTPLYTDLWKHKLSHEGGSVGNNEQGFINIMMAQQELILQQLARSEKHREEQFKLFKSNIVEEMKNLKQTVLESTEKVSADVEVKMDTFSKTFFSHVDKVDRKSKPSQSHSKPGKEKILLVGDSLSRNLNLSVIKNVTDMDIKRAEAFLVAKDDPKARMASKNFTEIVPSELEKEEFSTLILQGGTNEISNLDVSGKIDDKIEALKQEIKTSSEKIFNIAENSLKENKSLKKVVILKRIFRCDTLKNDPNQIKNRLSEFGNRMLDDIWLTKGCPKNITIAQQPLECDGNLRLSRYGSPSAKGYDGIHMRGVMAVQHYTGSFVNVLLENLPSVDKN